MSTVPQQVGLPDALEELRDRLAAAPLRLRTAGREAATRAATSLVAQIDDYLLPAAARPRRAAAHGRRRVHRRRASRRWSTASLGAQVTPSGVLRPTTRAPVLVCAPADRAAFAGDRVLPGLRPHHRRTRRAGRDQRPAAGRGRRPAGRARAGRRTRRRLRGRGQPRAGRRSCWPRPTCGCSSPPPPATPTPSRGSCCAPPRSGAPRSPSSSTGCRPRPSTRCPPHLAGMLQDAGLAAARLFVVEERPLAGGCLPEDQVAPLRDLAARAGRRPGGARRRRPADPGRRAGEPGRPGGRRRRPRWRSRLRRPARCCARPAAAYARAGTEVADGVAEGQPAARRGARPLAGVRRHRRVDAQPAEPGRPAARPGRRERARPAGPGRGAAGARWRTASRCCCGPQADEAAERTVTSWRTLPGGAGLVEGREAELDRRLARVRRGGRGRGPRVAGARARPGPRGGRRTSAPRRGCCRGASTAPGPR